MVVGDIIQALNLMKTEVLRGDHPIALQHAADVLKHGGLVAFPTDTVYGLASLPFQADMVERLFAVKGRSSTKAIAVLVGEVAQVERVVRKMNGIARRLAERFWPGPLTLVVAGNVDLPDVLSQDNSVGVRMPDHLLALALLRQVGPLAVTSANLSGHANTNSALEVLGQLEGRIHLVLDGGRTPGGVPSTVVDCSQDELVVLREGPISLEQLQQALAS
jgi:L-threonylcarbamoyladenylate synthase